MISAIESVSCHIGFAMTGDAVAMEAAKNEASTALGISATANPAAAPAMET